MAINPTDVLHNPFIAGAIGLSIGGALAALRQVPTKVFGYFLGLFTVSAEIADTDPSFDWLKTWIDHQPGSKRFRTVTVNTSLDGEASKDHKKRICLAPAPGGYFLRYGGRLMWLSRVRKDAKAEAKKNTEFWYVRLLGRDQSAVRNLIAEAGDLWKSIYTRPWIAMPVRGYWQSLGPVPEREITSVVLSDGVAENLVVDAEQFLESRDWYKKRGVPYRRGYMFEGPPGTGKSSIVVALAHHLKKSVYVVNLSSISDDALVELLCSVPSGAIVLFEDIDATTRRRVDSKRKSEDDDRPEDEKPAVSLSLLLNTLDGLLAKEGRIVIMTTNHIERLDPALIRPGRVDKVYTLGYATAAQARDMFLRFFDSVDGAIAFGAIVGGREVAPAAIQEHLLRYRHDAITAVSNAGDLLQSQDVVPVATYSRSRLQLNAR